MAVNDFLPFAADPAANVMLQTDYTAAGFTPRILGFQTGTALSIQLNKVWRQATLISSMVGQFSVNNTGQDMLDDGSPSGQAALLAHFTAAVRQIATTAAGTGNWLPLTGGGLTGPLTINATGWQLNLNAPAGQPVGISMSRPAGQPMAFLAFTG